MASLYHTLIVLVKRANILLFHYIVVDGTSEFRDMHYKNSANSSTFFIILFLNTMKYMYACLRPVQLVLKCLTLKFTLLVQNC